MLHLPEKFPPVGLFSTDILLSDKKLFGERLEIENAHQAAKSFWYFLGEYFENTLKLDVAKNTTKSVYFDTLMLDILVRAHRTLRGRPAGVASDGERFPDQFSTKFNHARGQAIADAILHQLFPGQSLAGNRSMPRVRQEVEVEARHNEKEVKVYTSDDLPQPIFSQLNKTFHFQELKKMSFSPLFATFVPRDKYILFLDPESKSNSSLILDPRNPRNKNDTQVCIEVARDECHYKLPQIGMSMAEMFRAASHDLTTLQRSPEDGLLVEHEVKHTLCGKNMTDGMMVWAYARFVILLYELAEQFKHSHGHSHEHVS